MCLQPGFSGPGKLVVGIIKLTDESRDVVAQGIINCLDILLSQFWKVADVIGAEDVSVAVHIWEVPCNAYLLFDADMYSKIYDIKYVSIRTFMSCKA